MNGAEMAASAAPVPAEPVTLKLAKPIEVIDALVSSVTLQPPTGRHLVKAGCVMRYTSSDDGSEASVEILPLGMAKLIAACGNLTGRAVESMAAGDFMACSTVLMGFLAPTATF